MAKKPAPKPRFSFSRKTKLVIATVLLCIVLGGGYATREKYWDFLTYTDIQNLNANFNMLLMQNMQMRKMLAERQGS